MPFDATWLSEKPPVSMELMTNAPIAAPSRSNGIARRGPDPHALHNRRSILLRPNIADVYQPCLSRIARQANDPRIGFMGNAAKYVAAPAQTRFRRSGVVSVGFDASISGIVQHCHPAFRKPSSKCSLSLGHQKPGFSNSRSAQSRIHGSTRITRSEPHRNAQVGQVPQLASGARADSLDSEPGNSWPLQMALSYSSSK